MQQQARRLDLGRIVGDAETQRLEIREPRAELLSLFHVGNGAVEAELRAAERAGRDVEAPAVERAHRDLESLPLGADPVRRPGCGSASNITMAVGCECHPSFFSWAPKESPGVPFSTRKQEMPRAPALARPRHHEIDVGTAAARDERLGAVEHIMVVLAHGAGLQARGVGARNRARSGSSCRTSPCCKDRAEGAAAARPRR